MQGGSALAWLGLSEASTDFTVLSAVLQVLDPALTRPGRLSRRVVVPLPG